MLSDELVFCIQGEVFVFWCPVEKKKRNTLYLRFVSNDDVSSLTWPRAYKNSAGSASACFRYISPFFPCLLLSSCLLTILVQMLSNSCSNLGWSSCLLHSTQNQTTERERAAFDQNFYQMLKPKFILLLQKKKKDLKPLHKMEYLLKVWWFNLKLFYLNFSQLSN